MTPYTFGRMLSIQQMRTPNARVYVSISISTYVHLLIFPSFHPSIFPISIYTPLYTIFTYIQPTYTYRRKRERTASKTSCTSLAFSCRFFRFFAASASSGPAGGSAGPVQTRGSIQTSMYNTNVRIYTCTYIRPAGGPAERIQTRGEIGDRT